ncbi:MAG: hypothetical protein ACYST3_00895 [Planctomycetota bacterium]
MPSDWSFVSVDMEITNQCSVECLMCPRGDITRPKGMMSEEVFKTASDKLAREEALLRFPEWAIRCHIPEFSNGYLTSAKKIVM